MKERRAAAPTATAQIDRKVASDMRPPARTSRLSSWRTRFCGSSRLRAEPSRCRTGAISLRTGPPSTVRRRATSFGVAAPRMRRRTSSGRGCSKYSAKKVAAAKVVRKIRAVISDLDPGEETHHPQPQDLEEDADGQGYQAGGRVDQGAGHVRVDQEEQPGDGRRQERREVAL